MVRSHRIKAFALTVLCIAPQSYGMPKVNYTTEIISLALMGTGALLHVCMPSSFKATFVVKEQEYDLCLSHVLFGIGWMGICLGTAQKFEKPSSNTDANYRIPARGLYGWFLSKSKKQ